MKLCPRRIISCEPTVKVCEKFLHSWFYKESKSNSEVHDKKNAAMENDESNLKENSFHTNSMAQSPLINSPFKSISTSLTLPENPFGGEENNSNEQIESINNNNSLILTDNKSSQSQSGRFSPPFRRRFLAVQESSASFSSSVYFEKHEMKMFEQLRCHVCERHRCTALMAAIRSPTHFFSEKFTIHLLNVVNNINDNSSSNNNNDNRIIIIGIKMNIITVIKIITVIMIIITIVVVI